MTARPYNPHVRVGNWNEDIALEQEKIKDFLRRKETGDLSLSKTQNFLAKNTSPAELSHTADGNVHLGDRVLLRHFPSESAISATPSVYAPRDDGQIRVAAAPKAAPALRNVFTIVPFPDEDHPDTTGPLVYGQKVYLQVTAADGSSQYLFTERVSLFGGAAKGSANEQAVVLRTSNTGLGSYGTVWQFVSFDPQFRLESEGQPVPANKPLIIVSSSTNQALLVTRDRLVRSEYGVEYEVAALTRLTAQKVEAPENHFLLELN